MKRACICEAVYSKRPKELTCQKRSKTIGKTSISAPAKNDSPPGDAPNLPGPAVPRARQWCSSRALLSHGRSAGPCSATGDAKPCAEPGRSHGSRAVCRAHLRAVPGRSHGCRAKCRAHLTGNAPQPGRSHGCRATCRALCPGHGRGAGRNTRATGGVPGNIHGPWPPHGCRTSRRRVLQLHHGYCGVSRSGQAVVGATRHGAAAKPPLCGRIIPIKQVFCNEQSVAQPVRRVWAAGWPGSRAGQRTPQEWSWSNRQFEGWNGKSTITLISPLLTSNGRLLHFGSPVGTFQRARFRPTMCRVPPFEGQMTRISSGPTDAPRVE